MGFRPVAPAIKTVVALTDAATIATDASLGDEFWVTLGGSRTMGNPTNPVSGQFIAYRLKQDGVGLRLITWSSKFRFGVDVPVPVLTVTAAKTDYIGFQYNEVDDKWDCISLARGY